MAEADALAMLMIARRDLQAAQAMLDSAAFHEAVWGFQLQQTLEKALKCLRKNRLTGLGFSS
jgi:uncharacterized protein (DUF885 family)